MSDTEQCSTCKHWGTPYWDEEWGCAVGECAVSGLIQSAERSCMSWRPKKGLSKVAHKKCFSDAENLLWEAKGGLSALRFTLDEFIEKFDNFLQQLRDEKGVEKTNSDTEEGK